MVSHVPFCTKGVALTLVLFINHYCSIAQSAGFEFGRITRSELEMKVYDRDTSAAAVVLNEFGESYIDDSDDLSLVLKYHVKIKILKKAGLNQGDFSIFLRKINGKSELVRSVTGSTFNLENGLIRESRLDSKSVYKEDKGKFYDYVKFAVPNVRVGSVIEVEYLLESPFIRNFRKWEFQSDIPKVYSEFWARMPANFRYDVLLRGFLRLTKNENNVVRNCYDPSGASAADCIQLTCAIKDIPAFKEEEYMTARSNFLSSVSFELAEVVHFDGHKDKLTREWKDVEDELRKDPKFGSQLKRGGDIMDRHLEQVLAGETDPLKKAQKIYNFIRSRYRWNEVYGEYSEFGIKKAFDSQVGNVGDINLSLIAALKYAGLSVEPLLLSTRENGLINELNPVLSEYNYVIAKLNINNKIYLLDATDDFLPFGLIPERCLNGKGRVLGEKESYWYEVKAPEREKSVSIQNLRLESDGFIRGTINNTYAGYDAVKERKKLFTSGNQKDYIDQTFNKGDLINVKEFQIENADDDGLPFVLKLEIEFDAVGGLQGDFLLNPFIRDRWVSNPFKSSERLYPVDFGVPVEEVVVLNLEYPDTYDIVGTPPKLGLALPNSGGRYIFNLQHNGKLLTMNSSLLIGKTVFSSEEYHFLKELFNQVVATQQTNLLFKKK